MSDLLNDLETQIVANALAAGLPEGQAQALARNVSLRLRSCYGGCEHYIPSHDTAAWRQEYIRRHHNGTYDSRDRICQALGISRRTFYRLMK